MTLLGQFLVNNLLPAIVAGCLMWAFVHTAVAVLGIRHGKLRLCLYLAPVLKSTLVLLGLHSVLPWPGDVFGVWATRAVPPTTVVPVFLLLTGTLLLGRSALAGRSRRRLLLGAQPAGEDGRLAAALDRVMGAYRRNERKIEARCSIEPLPARPLLMVRERDLRTPAVITDRDPVVVFPASLLDQLEDAELDAVLAHELAHLYLRQPTSCFSSEGVRTLSVLNPFASLMASQLHREEEKACDDVAVDILGDPERYAGMLLRSYRYAAAHAGTFAGRLQFAQQLLGVRPALSDRVEHLMARDEVRSRGQQRLGFIVTWIVLIAVFFTS